jgi:hypothetical protein
MWRRPLGASLTSLIFAHWPSYHFLRWGNEVARSQLWKLNVHSHTCLPWPRNPLCSCYFLSLHHWFPTPGSTPLMPCCSPLWVSTGLPPKPNNAAETPSSHMSGHQINKCLVQQIIFFPVVHLSWTPIFFHHQMSDWNKWSFLQRDRVSMQLIPTSIGDHWYLRWKVLPKFIVRVKGSE